MIQRPRHHQAKFVQFKGLGQVIVCAALHRLHRDLLRTISGDHNNGGARGLGLQLAEKIQSALPGHFNVQQYEMGYFLGHDEPRGGNTFGFQDSIAGTQGAPHAIASRMVIINNQNGCGRLFRC